MAVFIDPEKYPIYGGDAWSQPIELGEYTGYTAAVSAGYSGTVSEWLALDPANADTWVPEDVSGWSDWSVMWRVAATATASITLTVDTTGTADGLLIVSASEAQTRAMGGPGVFDVQAASPNVRTFWRAKTSWTLDVTR